MAEQKKTTAAQRIENLEQCILQIQNVMEAQSTNITTLAKENDSLRQMLMTLSRRVNATIQAGNSQDVVQDILIEEGVRELKNKVDLIKEQGVLLDPEKEELHERSFVVGREVDENGKVINPRMQFSIASLKKDFQDKVVGKKVGDLVENFTGDGIKFEILETYDILDESNQSKSFEEPKQSPESEEGDEKVFYSKDSKQAESDVVANE